MFLIEILVALALAGGIVAALRRAKALDADLQRARSQNYERYYEILGRVEDLQAEVKDLRAQVRRATGDTARFTPDMTFGEALALHPAAQSVFAGFHLGGCGHCAVDDDDTLAEAARAAHVDLAELLHALNGLWEGRSPAPRPAGRSAFLQIEGLSTAIEG